MIHGNQNNVIPITAKTKRKDAYNLEPAFERMVVTIACKSPKFCGALHGALDPECLGISASTIAMRACFAIQKDGGRGPAALLLVIQRLRRMQSEGKVTTDEIIAVSDLFDAAEDAGLLDEDAVLVELTPILRRRVERDAVEKAVNAFQKREDLDGAFTEMERAKRIGLNDTSIGTLLGPDSFDQIERLKSVQHLPTGIVELDDLLRGGPMRGTLSMFLGGPGGGKSMGLMQVACEAARHGFHAAVATLEIPEAVQFARCMANLTGIPIDDIMEHTDTCGVREALARVQSNPNFGRVVVKHFSPGTTTVTDLTD